MTTKQQEQSSIPMNSPSKTFIPIDQRKWKDIPAVDSVKEESAASRISKKVTTFSRHQEPHRAIDGAIDWCSMLPVLRREFEIEGGVCSDSQWLDLKHRGNKPRFQHCMANENLMYIRVQDHSRGLGWKESSCQVGGSQCRAGSSQVETPKDGRLSLQLWTPWANPRNITTERNDERYTEAGE